MSINGDAYIRGGGAYNQNKKKRYKTNYSCFDQEALKHHIKMNLKQGKPGGGAYIWRGLITGCIFWVYR